MAEFDILFFSVLQFHNLLKLFKEEVIDHHGIQAGMLSYFHLLVPRSQFNENSLHCIFFP